MYQSLKQVNHSPQNISKKKVAQSLLIIITLRNFTISNKSNSQTKPHTVMQTQSIIAKFYTSKYNKLVRNEAYKKNVGTATIEDKIQNTILYILERELSFDSVEQLEQYVRTSIKSKVINDATKQKFHPHQSVNYSVNEQGESASEVLAGVCYINEYEYDIQLFEAKRTKALQSVNVIAAKNTPYDKVGQLYVNGYKYEEIASELGITLSNVKSILKRLIDKGILTARNKSK